MKVSFLGNNRNPLSVRCFERIVADGSFQVQAGIEKSSRGGISRTVRKGLRRYGASLWFPKMARYTLSALIGSLLIFSGRPGLETMTRLAKRNGVEYFECEDVNSKSAREALAGFQPDVVVLGNFSQILKRDVIAIPPKGCVNVHPSLLPAYRGPTPLYWMLKNGDREGGVTVHFVDEGIDTGDIILQHSFPIGASMTEQDLLAHSAEVGSEILLRSLHLIRSGNAPRKPQDPSQATYLSFPRRERLRSTRSAGRA